MTRKVNGIYYERFIDPKNYLASIYAEKRAYRVLLLFCIPSHLLTNSTTIFTFVGMGVQWDSNLSYR
jgi:hypothetical protein